MKMNCKRCKKSRKETCRPKLAVNVIHKITRTVRKYLTRVSQLQIKPPVNWSLNTSTHQVTSLYKPHSGLYHRMAMLQSPSNFPNFPCSLSHVYRQQGIANTNTSFLTDIVIWYTHCKFDSYTVKWIMTHVYLHALEHDWLVEQDLTSHQRQYRSHRGRFFLRVRWPTLSKH